jgi:NAD(P) transhydrogenase subunit alpha
MKFGIPAETPAGETRVAATPEMVNKPTAPGRHTVYVQSARARVFPLSSNYGRKGFAAALVLSTVNVQYG